MVFCAIPEELKDTLKKFRFKHSVHTNALILKVNRETKRLELESALEDCEVDEIRDELPAQQPRFVVVSYELKHADGRSSYPLALLFYSPPGCSPELQMIYAGSRNVVANECELTKSVEVRDIEDITKELLDEKFA
ncbi:Protein Y50D7A.10 [Aphelenchoides avenae]|nr:Protein Y50D7A.10 [Aphelenchus avenae]